MIINAPTLRLELAVDFSFNSPLIGYHNIATTANISTTTQDTDYPRTNLANPSTASVWKGTALSSESITINLGGSTLVDYIAIAKHNFFTIGSTVQLELATDGVPTYSTVIAATSTQDDGPLILRFNPALYTYARVTISAGSAVPQAAVLYAGKLLPLQRRIYVGHTPLNLGRDTRIITGRSEAGDFLGRIQIGEGVTTNVSLKNLTPDWVRSEFDPFIVQAKTLPFFFAWRPQGYPKEVGFAWLTQDTKPMNQLPNGMMQAELSLSGIV